MLKISMKEQLYFLYFLYFAPGEMHAGILNDVAVGASLGSFEVL